MKEKRLDLIKNYIKEKKSVSLEELKDQFKISMNTVRRDINFLISEEYVKKVYGGVIFNELEPIKPLRIYEKREELNIKNKELIGKKAAEYISDNDTIFIDSGTTTLKIIPFLKDKKNITVITYSLPVINALYQMDNIKTIILPGILLRETASFIGSISNEFLKPFNIQKAFMSCNGITENRRITNATYEEYEIKKNIINRSEKVYLLADHEKFGNGGIMSFAEFIDIDFLITDYELSENFKVLFQNSKIEIVL